MGSENHRARVYGQERREGTGEGGLFVLIELMEEVVGEDDRDTSMEVVQRVEFEVFERGPWFLGYLHTRLRWLQKAGIT